MTVESTLTRELNIRFIDARNMATEARSNLGIRGYPTTAEEHLIHAEAIRLFEQRPENTKTVMRRLSNELESIKMPRRSISCGSEASSEVPSICEEHSGSPDSASIISTTSSSQGRKFKMWPTRQRC